MRTSAGVTAIVLLFGAISTAQVKETNIPPSTWSVAIAPFNTQSPATAVKAILTPSQAIFVTRIEAFAERGPIVPTGSNLLAKPCPVQFALQISNGTTTQVIPISNQLRKSGSSETYTDSSRLNLSFAADVPVELSLIVPPATFPPVQCTCNGLNVAIQYRGAGSGRR